MKKEEEVITVPSPVAQNRKNTTGDKTKKVEILKALDIWDTKGNTNHKITNCIQRDTHQWVNAQTNWILQEDGS